MKEVEIGFVEHWFGHLMVAGIKITNGPLRIGDKIHVKGHTSDFTTTIDVMEIEHKKVEVVDTGADIGVKLPDHARQHDKVYKVTE